MVDLMPPRNDKKEAMEQVSLHVPAPMIQDIDRLAKAWGLGRNEVFRQAIAEGLPTLFQRDSERLERENKILVQEKLKRRPECIRAAIELLVAGGDPAEIKRLLEESIG
jgi:metal-responsive CopG/Arc/MetJ family transcriptional regulator